jgi:hypothetical protein
MSNILDRSGDEPSAEFPSKLLKSGNPPPAGDEPEAEEEDGELPPNIEVKSGMFINPPLPVLSGGKVDDSNPLAAMLNGPQGDKIKGMAADFMKGGGGGLAGFAAATKKINILTLVLSEIIFSERNKKP